MQLYHNSSKITNPQPCPEITNPEPCANLLFFFRDEDDEGIKKDGYRIDVREYRDDDRLNASKPQLLFEITFLCNRRGQPKLLPAHYCECDVALFASLLRRSEKTVVNLLIQLENDGVIIVYKRRDGSKKIVLCHHEGLLKLAQMKAEDKAKDDAYAAKRAASKAKREATKALRDSALQVNAEPALTPAAFPELVREMSVSSKMITPVEFGKFVPKTGQNLLKMGTFFPKTGRIESKNGGLRSLLEDFKKEEHTDSIQPSVVEDPGSVVVFPSDFSLECKEKRETYKGAIVVTSRPTLNPEPEPAADNAQRLLLAPVSVPARQSKGASRQRKSSAAQGETQEEFEARVLAKIKKRANSVQPPAPPVPPPAAPASAQTRTGPPKAALDTPQRPTGCDSDAAMAVDVAAQKMFDAIPGCDAQDAITKMRQAGDTDETIACILKDALDVTLKKPAGAGFAINTIRNMAVQRRAAHGEQARAAQAAEKRQEDALRAVCGSEEPEAVLKRCKALLDSDTELRDELLKIAALAAREKLGMVWSGMGTKERIEARKPFVVAEFLAWEAAGGC